jgi:hypothetical protein
MKDISEDRSECRSAGVVRVVIGCLLAAGVFRHSNSLAAETPVAAMPQVILCIAQGAEQEHCSAEVSGDDLLVPPTGEGPCLLGKSWGYDDEGVWVEEGCGDEFELGGELRTGPTKGQPPATDAAVAGANCAGTARGDTEVTRAPYMSCGANEHKFVAIDEERAE